jgi:hypothetical protein
MSESLEQPPSPETHQNKPLAAGGLVIWLLLVPVVFGTLLLFSQLAIVFNIEDLAANTRSLLQAKYNPWPYDEIPAINVEALISDIQKDVQLLGTPAPVPTIKIGEFLKPPTPAASLVPQPTNTPETPPPTATIAVNTQVAPTPSRTSTRVITLTSQPTFTPTRTVFIPSLTFTPETQDNPPTRPPTPAKPTLTLTPTPTPTTTPTPTPTTSTPTPSPTATTPVPPTLTTVPPPPTNTPTATPPLEYLPVRPIPENNGESTIDPNGQGCLAYFGYRNDNPVEIDIPIGERNFLSEPPVRIEPGTEQTTHFYTDRVSPAFAVVWNSSAPFIWTLDGREAVAQWCNP